ncbi:hypothetical protein FJTKL_14809 [Diaporthe vaccinii]|uniref:Uncharacterized protein n=1 Tax=Diaporthe vaccinii TaxID=105482 RepID=A0ABR4F828_9PEZI
MSPVGAERIRPVGVMPPQKKKKTRLSFSLSNSMNEKIPLQYRESHANRKGANFKAGWPLSMPGPNRRARFSVPHPCGLPNRLEKSAAADLLLVNFKGIAILHFKLGSTSNKLGGAKDSPYRGYRLAGLVGLQRESGQN